MMSAAPQHTENNWSSSFGIAMLQVNAAMEHPDARIPSRTIDELSAEQTLQELSAGTYRPCDFFAGVGQSLDDELSPDPPSVAPDRQYRLFCLPVMTRLGIETSVPFGGIVFEDPVLAIAAAWRVGKRSNPAAVVIARNFEELWSERLARLKNALGARVGNNLFFVKPQRPRERFFSTLSIHGDALLFMRKKGAVSLNVGGQLQLFQLFQILHE